MPDIIPGARPTRMELIPLRKRRNIAQRGQDLLREKLDALMIEFFQFAREITALRAKTQDLLSRTYLQFAEAQMLMGATRLEETSLTAQDRFDVDATKRKRSEKSRLSLSSDSYGAQCTLLQSLAHLSHLNVLLFPDRPS